MEFRRFFRPRLFPSQGIPLGARSTGHYQVAEYWKDKVISKRFFQLFWGIRGKGKIIIEGTSCELRENTIAIYTPGMIHQIEACNEPWEYRWWTLDGSCACQIFEELGLRAGIYEAAQPSEELFGELEKIITNYSKESELRASAVAYSLLCTCASYVKASDYGGKHQSLITQVLNLCDSRWSDPDFNVNDLSNSVGLHRSRLSRLFTEAMKINPGDFISQIRIDNACSLLRETSLPITNIASQCGFRDPDYFTRIFKKKTGMSAKQFRLKND